jgi:hypothetical protein
MESAGRRVSRSASHNEEAFTRTVRAPDVYRAGVDPDHLGVKESYSRQLRLLRRSRS